MFVLFAETPGYLEEWKFYISLASLVISVVAFVVSFYFLGLNYRNNVRSNSAKMASDYSLKFNSPDMRKQRGEFAQKLLAIRDEARKAEPKDAGQEGVSDLASRFGLGDDIPVLSFMEDIAYLTKIGVLDSEMVWNSFIWHVERYYHALREPYNILGELRHPDYPAIFDRFEWLYHELFRIDRSERPKAGGGSAARPIASRSGPRVWEKDHFSPSDSQIDAFLKGEAALAE